MHVVKNTLFSLALDELGMKPETDCWKKQPWLVSLSTMPRRWRKSSTMQHEQVGNFKVKGGLLGKRAIDRRAD